MGTFKVHSHFGKRPDVIQSSQGCFKSQFSSLIWFTAQPYKHCAGTTDVWGKVRKQACFMSYCYQKQPTVKPQPLCTDTFRMKSSEKKNLQHPTGRRQIISSLSSIFCSLLLNNSNLSEYQLKRKEATKRGLKKKKASKCYISIIINRKSIAIGMIPKKRKSVKTVYQK